jgi:hypothetical protein
MKLTWKDGVTTVTMGLITAGYLAFLLGADLPVIDTVRGTTATVLILGMVGGCAFSGLDQSRKTGLDRFLIGLASVFGATALVAAIIAFVTASPAALAVLFGATAAVWLTATLRHALTGTGTQATLGPRTHEVIGPDDRAHRTGV